AAGRTAAGWPVRRPFRSAAAVRHWPSRADGWAWAECPSAARALQVQVLGSIAAFAVEAVTGAQGVAGLRVLVDHLGDACEALEERRHRAGKVDQQALLAAGVGAPGQQ